MDVPRRLNMKESIRERTATATRISSREKPLALEIRKREWSSLGILRILIS
jgi:hypothetical protein